MASPEILYLIVARGGSKGLPGKNLRTIAGISLVGYKALSARRSKYCSRLVISTDSAEIQEDARRYGVEVPFTRPAELASDTASSNDVVLHAIEHFERREGRRYDAVMLLEPSSPFARGSDYDGAVEQFIGTQANLVVGMREVDVSSVFHGPLGRDGSIETIINKIKTIPSNRRQDQVQEYTMNGALYLIGWDYMKEAKKIYFDENKSFGYAMDRYHSMEIENAYDLALAEFMVERGYINSSDWF